MAYESLWYEYAARWENHHNIYGNQIGQTQSSLRFPSMHIDGSNSSNLQTYVSPSTKNGRGDPQNSQESPSSSHSRCNCKKSKCLKLYCECFASLRYCVSCNCSDCNNTKDHEVAREGAIKATRERNSSAFVTKVNSNKGHATGCHCKNSLCLKKYCECFQAKICCTDICRFVQTLHCTTDI